MTEIKLSKDKKPLKGYLVGVRRSDMTTAEALEHLDELASLADTYGVPVVGQEIVNLREMNPAYLMGAGKVEQIARAAEALEADVIIIDDELSPSQQRNWEKLSKLAVIDRQEVILGIFADRAQTKEARLQVELARAEYSLPRLTRAWTHLERQRGGGGMRGGAGELQLEVDRRLLRLQIDKLKRDLKHVRQVRATQRFRRQSVPVPQAALVGYTNAGKSSLLNSLTGAGVLAEDKLFATLDPTTRKVILPNKQPLLITDTVGFIRKLPTQLVESFKATLEEAQLSKFLIHVVDASHPKVDEHIKATELVLEELGILNKPTLLVLNKVDLLEDRELLASLAEGYEWWVGTSTVSGEGMDKIAAHLADLAGYDLRLIKVNVPPDRQDVVHEIHEHGQVFEISHSEIDGSTLIEVMYPAKRMGNVLEYVVKQ